MKTGWLWISALLVLSCSSPQPGAVRGTEPGLHHPTSDGGIDNRVTCQDVVCDPNAACTGAAAQAKCACNAGFAGDGVTCADVDECQKGTSNCSKDATCTNRPGSFSCACNPGFSGDGVTCAAVNACAAGTKVCDPNAVCVNGADNKPSCQCNPGYTGGDQGCADVDECTANKFDCAANANCVNTLGSYGCACAPGFTGDGSKACTSLCDQAKADSTHAVCGESGLCRVTDQTAVCDACEAGFTGDGKTCAAASNCDAKCDGAGTDDDPHAVCAADGTCACAPGFTGAPGACADADECATNNGGCGDNAKCTNTPGGYLCACAPGFARDGGGKCAEVDECKSGSSLCSPNATCTNATPSAANPIGYTCQCKPGFTGDGMTCGDVDECATNNGGCATNATCVNLPGSSKCECQSPFAGADPKNCFCDLSGLWAMRQDTDTCWAALPIAKGDSQDLIAAGQMEANSWELHELTYDGANMKVRKKGCWTDNTPDLVSPLFQEVYSSYVPESIYDPIPLQTARPYVQKGLVPGMDFTTPTDAGGAGIDLGSQPWTAPWPASHDQVTTWVDTDGDGEPGITVWSRVPSQTSSTGDPYSYLPAEPAVVGQTLQIAQRAGCVSVAIRVLTHLEAHVDSCTHITGTVVNESTEGRVHSCILVDKSKWGSDVTCTADDWKNGTPCTEEDLGRLDDDQNQKQSSKATFEMVKIGAVGDSLNCLDVRKALPPISHVVPTITCTPPQ